MVMLYCFYLKPCNARVVVLFNIRVLKKLNTLYSYFILDQQDKTIILTISYIIKSNFIILTLLIISISIIESNINFIVVKIQYRCNKVGLLVVYSCISMIIKYFQYVQYINLEIRVSNLPSFYLHSYYGYQLFNYRNDYYQSPRENALLLSLGKVRSYNYLRCLYLIEAK
uniref:Ribosomal-protein-alanine acetyltransferase n=1 Tax=Corynoplastis japonica TaxID=700918 RepID=A0A1X9PU14_9RHOD|nr:ribosomal-protein-alanine acetyltransferase [Corynoplastis japonica]